MNHSQQQPKLENFLGGQSFGEHEQTYGGNSASTDYMFQAQPVTAGGGSGGGGGSSTNNGNSIGLSMIKTWLRNQPPHSANNNNNESGGGGNSRNSVQTLSLSMSTGSQSSSSLPLLTASVDNGESSSDNKQPLTTAALETTQTGGGAVETAPRKSIDTFGQRTSIYRGVTRFSILHQKQTYYEYLLLFLLFKSTHKPLLVSFIVVTRIQDPFFSEMMMIMKLGIFLILFIFT